MKSALLLVSLLLKAVCASPESELEHKNDFMAFDLNHDGYVDASEVRTQFEGIKNRDLSAFFIAADKNEDGLISLDEYLHASLKQDRGELDLNKFN